MRLLNGAWRLLYLISPLLHIFGFTVLFWGPLFTPYYFLFWMCMQTSYTIYVTSDTCIKLLLIYKSARQFLQQQKSRIVSSSQETQHVILVPNYTEELDLLRQTLRNLASHSLSETNYYVVLAQEEKEKSSVKKAEILISEFNTLFKDMFYTVHPFGIPGELEGKASNVNWAARHVYKILVEERGMNIDDILVTIADADSIIPEEFFIYTGEKYSKLTSPKEVCFEANPIYSVNSFKVSGFQRAVDLAHASLIMMQQRNYMGQSFPYSTYALSLNLIHAVDYWDCQPEAIGEDYHMYLKCFYKSQGRMIRITCPVPVFLASVEAENMWKSLIGRFKQTIRHMLGFYDIAYGISMFLQNITRISFIRNIAILYNTLESLIFSILVPYFQLGMAIWRFLPIADGYQELFETYRFMLTWLLLVPIVLFLVLAFIYERIYKLMISEMTYQPMGEKRSWGQYLDWLWLFFITPFFVWLPAFYVSFAKTFPSNNFKYIVAPKGKQDLI